MGDSAPTSRASPRPSRPARCGRRAAHAGRLLVPSPRRDARATARREREGDGHRVRHRHRRQRRRRRARAGGHGSCFDPDQRRLAADLGAAAPRRHGRRARPGVLRLGNTASLLGMWFARDTATGSLVIVAVAFLGSGLGIGVANSQAVTVRLLAVRDHRAAGSTPPTGCCPGELWRWEPSSPGSPSLYSAPGRRACRRCRDGPVIGARDLLTCAQDARPQRRRRDVNALATLRACQVDLPLAGPAHAHPVEGQRRGGHGVDARR